MKHIDEISVSLLLSSLQKAVRRRRPDVVGRIYRYFLNNFNEMNKNQKFKIVRRLPVIVLEDGMVTGNFYFRDAIIKTFRDELTPEYFEKLFKYITYQAQSDKRIFVDYVRESWSDYGNKIQMDLFGNEKPLPDLDERFLGVVDEMLFIKRFIREKFLCDGFIYYMNLKPELFFDIWEHELPEIPDEEPIDYEFLINEFPYGADSHIFKSAFLNLVRKRIGVEIDDKNLDNLVWAFYSAVCVKKDLLTFPGQEVPWAELIKYWGTDIQNYNLNLSWEEFAEVVKGVSKTFLKISKQRKEGKDYEKLQDEI